MKTFNCWLIANLEAFMVLFFILVMFLSSDKADASAVKIPEIVICIGLITILIGAILIAIYTWKNFDEVVSRQMLWRSSKVSFLDSRLKYTESRFTASLVVFLLIGVVINQLI